MALSSNLCCAEDAEDLVYWGVDDAAGEVSVDQNAPTLFPITGESLRSLLAAEDGYMPQSEYMSRYLTCSVDLTARQDAINWILNVSEFYRFRPVTVYLSVNYLDRFLSVSVLPGQNGTKQCAGNWPMQLLSVACLSVAAKMEETKVPLLLDLQILHPEFVFEPRTVCRMELLLMSALRWRMRAVTPFDFISTFAAAIVFADGSASIPSSAFSRSADLILSTHRVIDFLGFRPSVIAAAAVLCAASEAVLSSATYDSSIFDDWVNKEMVSDCRQLMEEYLIDTCQTAPRDTAALPAVEPLSPVGILDAAACASCDTQRSPVAGKPNSDPGGSELPPTKRRRLSDSLCTVIINTRS
ncbi:hypothetical protein IEQ34_020752 [Dendrobium chrysotoxum]|uniref:Cyclin N-terminal domain-containing protein n=1 Tax=Dendrobium chrysotoxum TaxID=161865 RepID=A0AAV7FKM9_DENCH|nr:hypothetical protein IEQ34_020752 [Dendrobium chrysotoxum]